MPRIQPVRPEESTGKTKELLDAVQAKLGVTPNMMKTMAQSPAVLNGYLSFNNALAAGSLPAAFREQIALAVAQANSCDYCLSAHTALGARAGLTGEQIEASRDASASEAKRDAGLKFARAIAADHGQVSDEMVARVRAAGYTDPEITEIIANVALNVFTNYINIVAGTDIDFPAVSAAAARAHS